MGKNKSNILGQEKPTQHPVIVFIKLRIIVLGADTEHS